MLFVRQLFGPNLGVFQGTKFEGPLGRQAHASQNEIFKLLNKEHWNSY